MEGKSITLEAKSRQAAGKKVKALRSLGKVPGVLYGFQVKNQPVECNLQEFHKVFVQAGESTVVDLQVEGKSIPVLIHQIALDPVKGTYEHVDFVALDMMKEVTTHVPLRTVGEAPGVKELGGVLVHTRDTLTVKCLPKDLPHAIEADISSLQNFYDTITVAALQVPKGVHILERPEEIVVSLQPPRKEEEVVTAVAPVEGVVAEGEAAPGGAAGSALSAATPGEEAKKGEKKEDKKGK